MQGKMNYHYSDTYRSPLYRPTSCVSFLVYHAVWFEQYFISFALFFFDF
jgi:hypothetical protein